MDRINLHATALVLGARGLLIFGASGAGKSSLALSLLDLYAARGTFACLVSDDRVWLCTCGGRLVAEAPEAIAGLAEIRGFGPAPIGHEPRAVVDRAVALVDPASASRHRDDACEILLGVSVPRLDLPAGEGAAAARAIAAWLELA